MDRARTKIVATIGPATRSYDQIRDLIRAGMSVARLNFSHGSHEEHREVVNRIRAAADELGMAVAILQDLQGPKIRTGKLLNNAPVTLKSGQKFTITNRPIEGTDTEVSTTYAPLPHDVRSGDRILLCDGLIELRVIESNETDVLTRVVNGGVLNNSQGINLPGVNVSAPAVTEKDYEDLLFGMEMEVDYIALSFVRTARDIEMLKTMIAAKGKRIPIIAKIEKPEALDHIDAILAVADGIMVARGDLGVELPPEKVPLVQKELIRAANARAIPVITATQMLESMIYNPRPTRAEASDVANAILDGSDAVMLSGETARGAYPIEAVAMMTSIALEIEGRTPTRLGHEMPADFAPASIDAGPQAVGAAINAIARTLSVKSVWVYTQQRGNTTRLIASYRPRIPVLAFTPHRHLHRKMALLWGVEPIMIDPVTTIDELSTQARSLSEYRGIVRSGDTVVITSSYPFNKHGESNFLRIFSLD